jgi:hypothetical protein
VVKRICLIRSFRVADADADSQEVVVAAVAAEWRVADADAHADIKFVL